VPQSPDSGPIPPASGQCVEGSPPPRHEQYHEEPSGYSNARSDQNRDNRIANRRQNQTYPQGDVASKGNEEQPPPVSPLGLDGSELRTLRPPLRRASPRDHAETSIPPYWHISSASEDGESSLVDGRNETQQLPAGAGAETPVGKGATGFRRKRGRRRALPRDPFLSAARRYLDDLKPYRAPLTLEQLRRDLRTTARDLWHLRREGNVANVRPEAMKEEDVGALLLHWRTRPTRYGRPMDPTSQAHLFRALKGFLEWCGNGAISRMKARGHVRFPRVIEKPIEVLDSEDLRRLREGADRIDGWNGSVARFLAVFLSATGLRPKEIRLARLRDLELDKGRIFVSHPKGEGSWAAADYAPILSFAREAVLDFLAEREAYLRGEPCEALIPYRRVSGEIGPWSEAMLRKLKARMERESGVRFHLRTLRPTFAQTAKDARVSIEAVSRALRHGSTRTTEAYYARIRGEDAFREIERAFERPVVKLEPESR